MIRFNHIKHNIMLIDEYKALTSRKDFYVDSEQETAIAHFQEIYDSIIGKAFTSNSIGETLVKSLFNKKEAGKSVRGLYLWGGVGRGKTFLMDLFYRQIPISKKKRIHFHRFMNQIHEDLHKISNKTNPLKDIAKKVSKDCSVLCFDEFIVNDIGDAMILSELLQSLFEHNVIVIFTSNSPPEELYKDGLQREKFVPTIDLICKNTKVLKLGDGEDYRLIKMDANKMYYYPHTDEVDIKMQTYFSEIAPDWFNWFTRKPVFEGTSISLNNRDVPIRYISSNTVWFSFDIICGDGRSAKDYIELSKIYENIFISNINILDEQHLDMARRFINMIDEFYDRNVKVVISAQEHIDKICSIKSLSKDFDRTTSRIKEMQSHEYIAKEHKQ